MSQLTTKERLIQAVTPVVLPLIRLYWFIFRPHTQGVKVVLKNHDNQILLVRHTYGSRDWTFPGGRMEGEETPKETACREMKEELAVKLKNVQVHDSFVSTKEYKHDHITVCSAVVTEKVDPSPFEIAQARWFEERGLPELGDVAQEIYDTYMQGRLEASQTN